MRHLQSDATLARGKYFTESTIAWAWAAVEIMGAMRPSAPMSQARASISFSRAGTHDDGEIGRLEITDGAFKVSNVNPECSMSGKAKLQPPAFRMWPMPELAKLDDEIPELEFGRCHHLSEAGLLHQLLLGARCLVCQFEFNDASAQHEITARAVEAQEMRGSQVLREGRLPVVDFIEKNLVLAAAGLKHIETLTGPGSRSREFWAFSSMSLRKAAMLPGFNVNSTVMA